MTVPFENDTGNIVRKLARKSLKSEKRRNLMVVIAVALASCLICFSIVMALSTRQIEKNHVEDTYEAVYTRITEEDVSTLKGLDDFSRVESIICWLWNLRSRDTMPPISIVMRKRCILPVTR